MFNDVTACYHLYLRIIHNCCIQVVSLANKYPYALGLYIDKTFVILFINQIKKNTMSEQFKNVIEIS